MIGIPLGFLPKRTGKSYEFILSILVVLGYYILLTSSQILSNRGTVPPALASWTPNIVLMALGIYLFIKVGNESTFRFLQWLIELVEAITSRSRGFFKNI